MIFARPRTSKGRNSSWNEHKREKPDAHCPSHGPGLPDWRHIPKPYSTQRLCASLVHQLCTLSSSLKEKKTMLWVTIVYASGTVMTMKPKTMNTLKLWNDPFRLNLKKRGHYCLLLIYSLTILFLITSSHGIYEQFSTILDSTCAMDRQFALPGIIDALVGLILDILEKWSAY